MTPAVAIARLNAALLIAGEDIVVRRITVSPPATIDVTVRARVPARRTRETAEGVTQDVVDVICSPTEMTAAVWPLPPIPGDYAIIAGKLQRIEAVTPIRMAGEIVRIEMETGG